MAVERIFVREGLKEMELQEYLKKKFERAGYSRSIIERTPIGTRIIIYVHKPGLVIGRSGRRVSELEQEIKEKFKVENPMVDIREVENPLLDANIVAKRIARAIERGIHYKKVATYYLDQIMKAGAIGCLITISGKIMGKERSRRVKFKDGFIATSGEYADRLVDRAQAQALIRFGIVGVEVRIMKEMPKEFVFEKNIGDKVEEERVLKEIEGGKSGAA
ncbi:MAG: 30S ribosomal protein S3 [Candidatus Aenigmarchaeota archaeon]|nr:30S ribosomal protein S3 [Candidatus Aenigmarchaeota archaeon]MDW8160228.1 30S ribosomal protein S3 [Candidatus Aenigmarchaeota archaeon]